MNKVKVVLFGDKDITNKCSKFLQNDPNTDLVLWVKDSQSKNYEDIIKKLNADYLISVQYKFLIPQHILSYFSKDCLNLHFGYLPKYGGCYPIAHAILNGDSAGFTLHKMSAEFDKGPIIHRQKVDINKLCANSAYQKVSDEAFRFFVGFYPIIKSGEYNVLDIKNEDITYYDKNSIDFNRDCYIDGTLSKEDIIKKFRAFTFPRYQRPKILINNEIRDVHCIMEIPLEYQEEFLRNISLYFNYDTYVFTNKEGFKFITWLM